MSPKPERGAMPQPHDTLREGAEFFCPWGNASKNSALPQKTQSLPPHHQRGIFPLESFEEKGNADVALEHVLSCHFWGVGILGDLRNKEFPQFIRALHIFKPIFQSSDTVG